MRKRHNTLSLPHISTRREFYLYPGLGSSGKFHHVANMVSTGHLLLLFEYLLAEPSRQLLPSTRAHFNINEYHQRGLQTLTNLNIVADEHQEHQKGGILKPSNDGSAVKHTAISNLKTSPRHDLAMIFTCRVCETRSVKTICRESYEKGVVVARCGGCNNLHLIADHLGWFGEPGSIEDFLAARGEEVRKGSMDTLNLTLEDLAGKEVLKD